MPSFTDFLSAMVNDDDEPESPKLAPDMEAIRLRDSLAALGERHEFRPGMIVRQKPQAMLYKIHGDNDLAIVVAMIEPIIQSEGPPGTQFYRHRVDMIIANIEHVGETDHFTEYHVDSRRFEPAPF